MLCTKGKMFTNKVANLEDNHLKNEVEGIEEKKYNICNICNKHFARPDLLSHHIVLYHAHMVRKKGNEHPYSCSVCKKVYKNKVCYLTHIQGHKYNGAGKSNVGKTCKRKKPTYMCSVCDKTFLTENILKAHAMVHNDYKCKVCLRTFRWYSSLWNHAWVHTDLKPFVCSVCGKGFGRLYRLKYHAVIHSDARPFVCHTCGKSFKLKGSWKDHEKTHKRASNLKFATDPDNSVKNNETSDNNKVTALNKIFSSQAYRQVFSNKGQAMSVIKAVSSNPTDSLPYQGEKATEKTDKHSVLKSPKRNTFQVASERISLIVKAESETLDINKTNRSFLDNMDLVVKGLRESDVENTDQAERKRDEAEKEEHDMMKKQKRTGSGISKKRNTEFAERRVNNVQSTYGKENVNYAVTVASKKRIVNAVQDKVRVMPCMETYAEEETDAQGSVGLHVSKARSRTQSTDKIDMISEAGTTRICNTQTVPSLTETPSGMTNDVFRTVTEMSEKNLPTECMSEKEGVMSDLSQRLSKTNRLINKAHICTSCGKVFKYKPWLQRHRRNTKHCDKMKSYSQKNIKNEEKDYIHSSKCKVKNDSTDKLAPKTVLKIKWRRIKTRTTKKTRIKEASLICDYKCKLCEKKYKHRSSAYRHLKRTHKYTPWKKSAKAGEGAKRSMENFTTEVKIAQSEMNKLNAAHTKSFVGEKTELQKIVQQTGKCLYLRGSDVKNKQPLNKAGYHENTKRPGIMKCTVRLSRIFIKPTKGSSQQASVLVEHHSKSELAKPFHVESNRKENSKTPAKSHKDVNKIPCKKSSKRISYMEKRSETDLSGTFSALDNDHRECPSPCFNDTTIKPCQVTGKTPAFKFKEQSQNSPSNSCENFTCKEPVCPEVHGETSPSLNLEPDDGQIKSSKVKGKEPSLSPPEIPQKMFDKISGHSLFKVYNSSEKLAIMSLPDVDLYTSVTVCNVDEQNSCKLNKHGSRTSNRLSDEMDGHRLLNASECNSTTITSKAFSEECEDCCGHKLGPLQECGTQIENEHHKALGGLVRPLNIIDKERYSTDSAALVSGSQNESLMACSAEERTSDLCQRINGRPLSVDHIEVNQVRNHPKKQLPHEVTCSEVFDKCSDSVEIEFTRNILNRGEQKSDTSSTMFNNIHMKTQFHSAKESEDKSPTSSESSIDFKNTNLDHHQRMKPTVPYLFNNSVVSGGKKCESEQTIPAENKEQHYYNKNCCVESNFKSSAVSEGNTLASNNSELHLFKCTICLGLFKHNSSLKRHLRNRICKKGPSASMSKTRERKSEFIDWSLNISPKDKHKKLDANLTNKLQHTSASNKIEDHHFDKGNAKIYQNYINHWCKVCFKEYTAVSSLKRHMKIHCSQTLSSGIQGLPNEEKNEQDFNVHIRDKNQRNLNSVNNSDNIYSMGNIQRKSNHPKPKLYKCETCEKMYTAAKYVLKHQKKRSCHPRYECRFCKKRFKTENIWKLHMLAETTKIRNREVTCKECSTVFCSVADLGHHTIETTCNICAKSFSCTYKYNVHKDFSLCYINSLEECSVLNSSNEMSEEGSCEDAVFCTPFSPNSYENSASENEDITSNYSGQCGEYAEPYYPVMDASIVGADENSGSFVIDEEVYSSRQLSGIYVNNDSIAFYTGSSSKDHLDYANYNSYSVSSQSTESNFINETTSGPYGNAACEIDESQLCVNYGFQSVIQNTIDPLDITNMQNNMSIINRAPYDLSGYNASHGHGTHLQNASTSSAHDMQ